jgi:hypothetical protein
MFRFISFRAVEIIAPIPASLTEIESPMGSNLDIRHFNAGDCQMLGCDPIIRTASCILIVRHHDTPHLDCFVEQLNSWVPQRQFAFA